MILFRHARMALSTDPGTHDVLVGGGRVVALAPRLPDPPADWPVEVVDLEGRWLAPGLVDVHTHLTGGGGEGGAHTRVPPVQLTELTMAGVTTAIGLLGTDGTTRSPAELLATARGLAHFGLTCLCYTGSYEVPPVTLTGSVRGDLVHVDRFVAVGEIAISDHRSSQPTFDELARLAADAHVAGLMTGKAGLLHLHLGDGPRGLDLVRRLLRDTELPARVLHPTHVNRNPDLWVEARDLLQTGGFLDLTAFPPDDEGVDAAHALADVVERGLPLERVTMSSDGGGCLPVFGDDGTLQHMDVGASSALLHTVRRAVAAGVPLASALATVTTHPARLFRLHGKGSLHVGADADLVVLDEALDVVHTVAAGRLLVRDGVPCVRGPFEPPSAVAGSHPRR